MSTLLKVAFEPNSLCTANKCYEILRRKIKFRQASNVQTIVESFVFVMNCISFTVDHFSSHSKNHGRAPTVFNCCVPTQLNQVRNAQHLCDVVSIRLNFLNLRDSLFEFFRLGKSKLVF